MNYIRNPEVKKELIIFLISYICMMIAGFWIFGVEGAIFAAVIGMTGASLHFFSSYLRYRKIIRLTDTIDHALHDSDFSSGELEEGELSILASEIHRLFGKLAQQTELLSREKEFLADSIADISHQIRTPLTSMNLVVTRLRNEEGESRRRLLMELEQRLYHIDWLVEALLKMAKFDAGTIRPVREKVSVKALCEKAVEPIAITIELRGQILVVEDHEAAFWGDKEWTAEALINIIKNCSEHTPPGGTIQITAGENALYTEVLVEDDGEGFDENELPHIFERFFKGSRRSEGDGNPDCYTESEIANRDSIGIGLALARTIITNEEGVITAENRREGGARFRIRFYKSVV